MVPSWPSLRVEEGVRSEQDFLSRDEHPAMATGKLSAQSRIILFSLIQFLRVVFI